MTSSTLAFRGFALLLPLLGSLALHAEVNQVETLAPGVYFHEGDIKGHGHCNNGWIVF